MENIKPAFLFPGQGSQSAGMGRQLFDAFPIAKAVFDEADEALSFPLSDIIFNGPAETLQLTEHTQPAILTVSIAAFRVLQQSLPGLTPAFVAGHSLGEYSALVAANSLSFADAVRTVRLRGQFMQQAVPEGVGSMAAILGLLPAQINDICALISDELLAVVSPANLNAPEQTVISGSFTAVERAVEACKLAGAKKTVILKVSAPFHCALMQPAQDHLATTLEAVTFSDPTCPIACNVDARFLTRPADICDCLIRQVTGPVRWVECINLLVQSGATHLIEVGPGKILTGLTRQILGKGVEFPLSLNVEDTASLEKTLAALQGAN